MWFHVARRAEVPVELNKVTCPNAEGRSCAL